MSNTTREFHLHHKRLETKFIQMKWHIERTKLRSKVKCTITTQVLFGKIYKALIIKGRNETQASNLF
jgi:hypothetical protein